MLRPNKARSMAPPCELIVATHTHTHTHARAHAQNGTFCWRWRWYLTVPKCCIGACRPEQMLLGFARTQLLKPGDSTKVCVPLDLVASKEEEFQ